MFDCGVTDGWPSPQLGSLAVAKDTFEAYDVELPDRSIAWPYCFADDAADGARPCWGKEIPLEAAVGCRYC